MFNKFLSNFPCTWRWMNSWKILLSHMLQATKHKQQKIDSKLFVFFMLFTLMSNIFKYIHSSHIFLLLLTLTTLSKEKQNIKFNVK